MHKFYKAFTIVELLAVLVVLGVLATLIIIAYSGITSKANIASLQATLNNNKKLLTNYYNTYGSYPTALTLNCPSAPVSDSAYCLKAPANTTLDYSATSQSFSLHATQNSTTYKVTDSTVNSATLATLACPAGFIVVPGSATYGTSDFCVMKYEAKADNGSGVGDTAQNTGYDTWPADIYPISASRKLISTPQGFPVANITQTLAISSGDSVNGMVYGCPSGCKLITDAQWMTIVQNVLSVPSNWSSGIVGSGYIYSGHNDSVPNKALQADSNDSNGYVNTSDSSGNQRRTLTLTNGEVIWDLAGNAPEFTSTQITTGQPGASSNTGYQWTEWPNVNIPKGSMPVDSSPAGTGLMGAGSWNSSNGMGQLYSYTNATALRAVRRGGSFDTGAVVGVLNMNLGNSPSYVSPSTGFRLTK